MNNQVNWSHYLIRKIVILYAFFSSLWVLTTDAILVELIDDVTILNRWQSVKGWLFVLISSGIVYLLMCRGWYETQRMQRAWQSSQQQYQRLFENHPSPMWVFDRETLAFLAVNNAAIASYGYSREEFLSMSIRDIRPPEDIPKLEEHLAQDRPSFYFAGIWRHRKKDGTIIDVKITSDQLDFAGKTARVVLAEDVTESLRISQELERKEEQYRTLAHNFPNGAIFLFDKDLRYTLADGKGLEAINIPKESLEGKTIWEALDSETVNLIEPLYRQALNGISITEEIPFGQQVYLTHIVPIVNSAEEIEGGIVVTQNITYIKEIEAELQHSAFYDSLTGLPNTNWVLDHLQNLLHIPKNGQAKLFSVILLELERFSLIKYSLGHRVAEKLMVAAAIRLQAGLNLTNPVARVGDKTLAVILEDIEELNEPKKVADRIHQQLTLPFDLDGHEIFAPANIGIAIQGYGCSLFEPGCKPEDWLRAADTAMNNSRYGDKMNTAVFHPSMLSKAVSHLQLETDLRWAILRQQLQVFYQPIVSLETGKITGFEALVRWLHPKRGLITPDLFIPLAEETGLISQIDWWVLSQACQQLSLWQQDPQIPDSLTMSVNFSGSLMSQLGLLERLEQVLRTREIAGNCLKLEITERVIMEHYSTESSMIIPLKSLGVKLSIDDFGTGYSCLARLHQLPIDTLKIDRSFVQGIAKDQDSLEIVKTIMALAHSLKMDVIAEGVEGIEHLEQLRSLECEYGQGYYFSRPIDTPSATVLLKSQRQW